jgi:hypothetical protein
MILLHMILCDDAMAKYDVIARDVRLYAHSSGTAERIFTKFGTKVMPFQGTTNSYFLLSYTLQHQRDRCSNL